MASKKMVGERNQMLGGRELSHVAVEVEMQPVEGDSPATRRSGRQETMTSAEKCYDSPLNEEKTFLCFGGTGYVFELFKTSVLLSLEMFCLSCTLLDEVVNAEPLFIGLCRQGHTGYVSVLVAENALKVLVVFMPAACLFFIINLHFEYSKREWCYYKLMEHGILLDFDGYEGRGVSIMQWR